MGNNLPVKANNIRALLEKSRKQMEMALPKHLTVDRLLRVAMTSIQRTPRLLECTPQSLLACVMTCAQLGLEPDQFLGQAYLVPFNNHGQYEAQLIPGYRGYIALARRSGEVQSVGAQVVYANDCFNLQYGLQERLDHIPADGDRGEVKGAYVIFRYKDGSYSFDYMPKGDIDKIRNRSKSKDNGPWVTDYAEMAKKTVIKRHAKLAPMSVEFAKAAALEDRAMVGETQMDLLLPEAEEGETEAPNKLVVASEFARAVQPSLPTAGDEDNMAAFLSETAEANSVDIDAVKVEALKDMDGFLQAFKGWAAKRAHPAQAATSTPEATTTPPQPKAQSRGKGKGKEVLFPPPQPDAETLAFLEDAEQYRVALDGTDEWGKVLSAMDVEKPEDLTYAMRPAFIRHCKTRLDKVLAGNGGVIQG